MMIAPARHKNSKTRIENSQGATWQNSVAPALPELLNTCEVAREDAKLLVQRTCF